MTRNRAVSVVAVGALAGGIAVAATSGPWSPDGAPDRPQARAGDPTGADDAEPGAAPVPPTDTPAPAEAVPAVAPAPIAEPPAPSVWRADGPGAFRRTPWNTVGAPPPRVDDDEVAVVLTGRGQRSELEPAVPAAQEGDRHDVTFSVRLDGEFARSPAAQQVIARWENDGPGTAPLDLRVRDGALVLHGGEGHPSGPRTVTHDLGPAPVGEWTDLRVQVDFSANPDRARVSVWRDGLLVVDDHPPGGTLYPGQQSYLKVGLHRDRLLAQPSSVQFRTWHVEYGPTPPEPPREALQAAAEDPAPGAGGSASSDASVEGPSAASSRSASAQDIAAQIRAAEQETQRETDRETSSGERAGRTASEGRSASDRDESATRSSSSDRRATSDRRTISEDSDDRARPRHDRDDEPRTRSAERDGSRRDRSADDERAGDRSAADRSAEDRSERREQSRDGSAGDRSERSGQDRSGQDRSGQDRGDRSGQDRGDRSGQDRGDRSDRSDRSEPGSDGGGSSGRAGADR
ncbi:heparin lyase I family protein [Actinomycetospora straminea]|uniref:heparin lyase I family protein n=1 Tax=Actinomycetospora straminea TaxID=663607 RepID=UPI0031F163E2